MRSLSSIYNFVLVGHTQILVLSLSPFLCVLFRCDCHCCCYVLFCFVLISTNWLIWRWVCVSVLWVFLFLVLLFSVPFFVRLLYQLVQNDSAIRMASNTHKQSSILPQRIISYIYLSIYHISSWTVVLHIWTTTTTFKHKNNTQKNRRHTTRTEILKRK